MRRDAEVVEAVEQLVGEGAVAGDDDGAAGDRGRHQMSMIAPPSAMRVWPVM